MATFLDFSVKTREEFKDWILTSLGAPLITVELHDQQLEQCINNALEIFTKWISFDEDYIAINLENYVEDVGVTLPDNVVDIMSLQDDLLPQGNVSQLFSTPNVMYNASIWPSFKGQSGWTTFHVAQEMLNLTRYMCGKGFKFNYSCRTKILKLHPDPIKEQMKDSSIVCGVRLMRPENQLLGESWVKRYALACAKELLGRIRTKFSGVQLLGGGQIDVSVLQEGISDQKDLIEELKNESGPAQFFFM